MRRLGGFIDTAREVFLCWGASVVMMGSGVAVAEGWKLGDTLWWAVVTIFTVGYGDIAPHTLVGRLFATILIIVSWFFSLLLGAMLAAKLIVNSDAFTHEEQETIKSSLRRIERKIK